MEPTQGSIVHYTLDAEDAKRINRRRDDFKAYNNRLNAEPPDRRKSGEPGYTGQIGHYGNEVFEGYVAPAMVVRVWEGTPYVNLQVYLDGNDIYWATSVTQGDGKRQWAWPIK